MRTMGLNRRAAAALALTALAGCPSVQSPVLLQPGPPPIQPEKSPPLKVHLRSGDVLLLDRWSAWPGDSGVIGTGTRFDVRRNPVGLFNGALSRDSIALFEVTRSQTVVPAGSVILSTYTVLTGVTTLVCLSDPKACFGSCPTFYVRDTDPRPVAEGFSASVARSLEATDVDDLGDVDARGRTLALTMRNEALETHAVRSVRLLVAPRPPGGAVVRGAAGGYFTATDHVAPATCSSAAGDCARAVRDRDGKEWSSRADSTDLGARDSLDLTFPPAGGRRALLIASRQSLTSTYVFYQALAYAGSRAGDFLAEVERRGTEAFPGAWAILRRLTEVEVLAETGGSFRRVGIVGEAGPLAIDQYALPLPDPGAGAPLRVRLRFARGAWRFDRIASVRIAAAAEPVALVPVRVERDGFDDVVASRRLLDPDRYLVTQPGDTYRLRFALPDDAERLAFFLEARGYYYEWMRPEWQAEENLAMLGLVAGAPDEALRRMAPGYAKLEPRLEALFWSSRFGGR